MLFPQTYTLLFKMSTHIDRDLDLSNASRGVWLVKVPKYIANRWEKVSGDVEVGKLKISRYALEIFGQFLCISSIQYLSKKLKLLIIYPFVVFLGKDHRFH